MSDSAQAGKRTGEAWSPRVVWAALVGLLAVVGLLYGRVIGFEAIPSWDDGAYLFERPEVRDWWAASWHQRVLTPEIGYPLPVPTFLYAHVRAAFGDGLYPHAMHAVQVGLHLANVVLVFALVRRWFDARVGLAVAAIWGCHPLCVESVAWLTNLKTLLASGAMLGAMLVWERGLDQKKSSSVGAAGPMAAVGVLYLMALGSRPDAFVLPGLLGLQSLRARGWREAGRRDGLPVAVMVVVGGVYAAFAQTAHSGTVEYSVWDQFGPTAVVVRMARTLELSVRRFLWPAELHPGYFQHWNEGIAVAIPGLICGAALVVGVVVLVRERAWRLLFPVGLAAVAYAPFSNVVFLPRFTADTYLYLPGMAGTLTAVVFVRWAWAESDVGLSAGRVRRLSVAAVVGLVAVLGVLTWQQVGRWRNGLTLWGPVLEAQPQVQRPYKMVAAAHVRQKEWDRAAEVLRRGAEVFRASRRYPVFMPEVFEVAGDPRRAGAAAAEMLERGRGLTPTHFKVALEVLARREVPLESGSRLAERVERAARVYRDQPGWLEERSDRLTIADYLTKQRLFEAAVPFVRREFEAPRPHCFGWIALQRLPADRRQGIEAGSVPGRCRK